MVTFQFSKECETAISTSQYTASAHKARHAVFQIANNNNLLSNRIKRGTTCENIHKGAKWEREIETGDVPL